MIWPVSKRKLISEVNGEAPKLEGRNVWCTKREKDLLLGFGAVLSEIEDKNPQSKMSTKIENKTDQS